MFQSFIDQGMNDMKTFQIVQQIGVKLESLVHVSAPEVKVSCSCREKTHAEKTCFCVSEIYRQKMMKRENFHLENSTADN